MTNRARKIDLFRAPDSSFLEKGIQVELVRPDAKMLQEIGALRVQVWHEEGYFQNGSFSQDTWIDSHDEHAYHWIVRIGGFIIASARMCIHSHLHEIPDYELFPTGRGIRVPHDLPCASMNRLAVHPEARGLGIASEMDRLRVIKAYESGAKCIVARPKPRREKVLLHQGFVNLGNAQVDPKTPLIHDFFMLLRLVPGKR